MDSTDKPTSLTLLDRLRAREEEAWCRLHHLYAPLVSRWCAYRGIQEQDAADVSQEVFQAVATGLNDFRRDQPGDSFRGWLRGITRYKILDHFRRRAAGSEAQGGTDAQRKLLEVAQEELPEETQEDLGSLYHRALELVRGEFEQRTWEAFWRSAVDGQSPNDIAAAMGLTAVAVRKAKSRVLHRLRQEMSDLTA